MKKSLLIIAVILCIVAKSFATVHMVTVADFSFTPSTMTVHLGDTVMWMWGGGTHTTTNAVIPSSAATWNAPINSTATSFMYKPAVAGTYNYNCTIHPTTMIASFTVISAAGTEPVSPAPAFTIASNPAIGTMHLIVGDPLLPLAITVLDINGRELVKKNACGLTDIAIDVQSIPNGTYFLHAMQGNIIYKQQVVIAH